MGRLTKRTHAGVKCAYDPFKCEDQYEDGGCEYCVHMLAMMGKLAAYEELEEQSLLLRLPCKFGDTVYSVEGDGINEFVVSSFSVCRKSIYAYQGHIFIGEFGFSVFPTKEEAERALAERG